ncbi:MAG: methionine--tRNA ligase [Myxococcota bacterium]
MAERILITAALPYANGSAHLGHLLEQIQVDVFTRGHRLMGHDAVFLCADDTHGTPIEVNARKQGITPEQLVARSYEEHVSAFRDFLVRHDHYSSTNSDENRKYAELFFNRAKAKGLVFTKDVEQMYCEKDARFLPDRFIRGTCPRCKAPDQYGDSCEVCGATYQPTELLEPKCAICGTRPVVKPSSQYFFDLPKLEAAVGAWTEVPEHLQPEIRNFVNAWFKDGLRPWDISRSAPYFGFKIPGEADKYFYVWMDAPIGYVSTTEQYTQKASRRFEDYWNPTAGDVKIYHFIGKDIVYFHTLFWPALLTAAELRLPDGVFVHGMLTADGTKLSKSRGTFINARTYLNHLPPELLRYYFCTKLTAGVDDLDLSFDDFIGRVNGDLVNNIANLYSRAVKVVHDKLDGKIPRLADVRDTAARDRVLAFEREVLPEIGRAYNQRDYHVVVRRVLELTDFANKYIQDQKPWDQVKNDPKLGAETLSVALNAGKLVAVALQPILPKFADTVARMLKLHSGDALWEPTIARDGKADLGGETQYGPYIRLFDRIDRKQVDAIIEDSKKEAGVTAAPAEPAKTEEKKEKKEKKKEPAGPPPVITIDDFGKVDLRVGLVTEASLVEGADKLLRLTVDLGELGTRNIFAGIRKAYSPEQMKGKRVIVVANLAPRQMKFGVSEGMVLAAEDGGALFAITPDGTCKPGSKVA